MVRHETRIHSLQCPAVQNIAVLVEVSPPRKERKIILAEHHVGDTSDMISETKNGVQSISPAQNWAMFESALK
jgi:hypothetical protein